ncbi:hypothetical protein SLEP1_g10398 [Rubroshorea leprosula]|uniref:NAC domain-containing protein n=1 Tax=Rubroshorea leprosula TaxID=152421 RepID=A0AAV5IHV2_9ROSI|nr:hypothetical protein SLEP1_g10398 [Rubroshorea leprosula]
MDNISRLGEEDGMIELPPGFRFHPTDEELITHYLTPKVLDSCFCAAAVGQVDLNKCEPWDLPSRAKMGEKEWYFFCVRDRKYPTGLRTNRATNAGYWKATGKDKEIYRAKTLVGMKKTLVFYRGRAPKGGKTNWVMHEYRLEGKNSIYNMANTEKNEWVVCRVFHKTAGGKKINISGLVRLSSYGNEFRPSVMPPLMDSSPNNSETIAAAGETSHVTSFSNPLEDQKAQEDGMDSFHTSLVASSSSSNPSNVSPVSVLLSGSLQNPPCAYQIIPSTENLQFAESFLMQDGSILKMLIENQGENMKMNPKVEFSQDSGVSKTESIQRTFDNQDLSGSAGPVNPDWFWSY